MDNEADIKKLLLRAKKVAIRKGFEREAEDFSQVAVMKLMKGRKATLDQLLIDYLRENYTRTNKKGSKPNKVVLDVYNMKELSVDHLVHTTSPLDLYNFNQILKRLDRHKNRGQLRCFLVLRYLWGFNQQEIAHCFGITESRVCQLLKIAFSYIKDHYRK